MVLNHHVIREKYASDHLPVVATLRIELRSHRGRHRLLLRG